MKKTLLATLALVLAASVMAKPQFKSKFVKQYNLRGSNLANCKACHTSVPKLNDFGMDLEVALGDGLKINAALTSIEGLDSDGDGVSNIDEITAGTKPGVQDEL